MKTIEIYGESPEIVACLFRQDGENLAFGLTATSVQPRRIEELWTETTRFRDYVMEGFVLYDIQVVATDRGVALSFTPVDGPRSAYVDSQIDFFLKNAGFSFESEVWKNESKRQ